MERNVIVKVCNLDIFLKEFTRQEIQNELLFQLTQYLLNDGEEQDHPLFESLDQLNAFLDTYSLETTDLSKYTHAHVFCFGLLCHEKSIYSHDVLQKVLNQIQTGIQMPNKDELSIIWNVKKEKAIIVKS